MTFRTLIRTCAMAALPFCITACDLAPRGGNVEFGAGVDSEGKPFVGISGRFPIVGSGREVMASPADSELRAGTMPTTALPPAIPVAAERSRFDPTLVENDPIPRRFGDLRSSLSLDTEQLSVMAIVEEEAIAAGIDAVDFVAVAWIESELIADARNPYGSGSGIFQFLASTGKEYGLANPFDARENSRAAARLWRDNRLVLQRGLGREPKASELYLAHQQGAVRAVLLIRAGHEKASAIVGRDAVRLNWTGHNSDPTAAEFVAGWTAKFEKIRSRFFRA